MNAQREWYNCPSRRSAAWGHEASIISALQILYHKSKRAAFVSGLAARGAAVPPFGGKMFTRGKSLIFQSGNAAPARSTAPPWGYYTMNAQREWYNCPSRRSAARGHETGIISALRLLYHKSKRAAFVSGLAARGTAVPPFGGEPVRASVWYNICFADIIPYF